MGRLAPWSLVACAALAGCGGPAEYSPEREEPDNSQIIRAALAEIGGDTGFGGQICVSRLADGLATDRLRADFALHEVSGLEFDAAMRSGRYWYGPNTGSPIRPGLKELPASIGREIHASLFRAYTQPPEPVHRRARFPDGLANANIEMRDPEKMEPASCETRVYLTLPVISNEYAFVYEDMGCGPLCGSSSMLAFRRDDGKWHYVGRSVYSVS